MEETGGLFFVVEVNIDVFEIRLFLFNLFCLLRNAGVATEI